MRVAGGGEDHRLVGEQLFAAALIGDGAARDAFLVWLRPWVVSYARGNMFRRLKRWVDPEDVVQEVLVKSLEELDRLPAHAVLDDFLPSVWRTTTRRILDEQRKHRRKAGGSVVPDWVQGLAADRGSSGPVTRRDNSRWLERLIAELPPAYAEVVRLIALQGLDVASAARQLGQPAATVRKRYDRARRALQRRYRPPEGEAGS